MSDSLQELSFFFGQFIAAVETDGKKLIEEDALPAEMQTIKVCGTMCVPCSGFRQFLPTVHLAKTDFPVLSMCGDFIMLLVLAGFALMPSSFPSFFLV